MSFPSFYVLALILSPFFSIIGNLFVCVVMSGSLRLFSFGVNDNMELGQGESRLGNRRGRGTPAFTTRKRLPDSRANNCSYS